MVLEILQSIQQVMDQQCVRLHRNQQQLVANSLHDTTIGLTDILEFLHVAPPATVLQSEPPTAVPPETQVYVSMSLPVTPRFDLFRPFGMGIRDV